MNVLRRHLREQRFQRDLPGGDRCDDHASSLDDEPDAAAFLDFGLAGKRLGIRSARLLPHC